MLAGYEPQMKKMLRDQNPGLARRFNMDAALRFDDFTDLELLEIVSDGCRREQVRAPIAVKQHIVRKLAQQVIDHDNVSKIHNKIVIPSSYTHTARVT